MEGARRPGGHRDDGGAKHRGGGRRPRHGESLLLLLLLLGEVLRLGGQWVHQAPIRHLDRPCHARLPLRCQLLLGARRWEMAGSAPRLRGVVGWRGRPPTMVRSWASSGPWLLAACCM